MVIIADMSPDPIQLDMPCHAQVKRPAPEVLASAPKKPKVSPEERAKEKEQRETERLAREAEKEAKRNEREERKRMKEEAKARERQIKEEAKLKELAVIEKKEKSQLRMGNFFQKAQPKPVPILAKEESSIFKPFYLREHTRIAPLPRTSKRDDDSFLRCIKDTTETPLDLMRSRSQRPSRHRPRLTLKQKLLEASSIPVEERLKDTAYKLLQFHSDVRPAYFGTMTGTPAARGLVTGRNPCVKTSELNYDYDSEADWIEDDEDGGEDLCDEDVMSVDSYGDDSDDFLDDDDHVRANDRSRQQGSLLPFIQGIFGPDTSAPIEHMKLQTLIDTQLPIDPFHDYWSPTVASMAESTSKSIDSPTRTTLNTLATNILRRTSNHAGSTAFPEALLPEFKKAINGSNMTKVVLVEKLRTMFKGHKVSKKAIEDKLGEVAQRLGRSQHDVWTLKS